MKPQQYKEVQALASRHAISFIGPRLPRSWPDCHRETFAKVDELGQFRYIEFERKYAKDADQYRKREIAGRVLRLVEQVRACIAERANEQVWRLRIESLIFARFHDPPIWSDRCGGRLWRSEIEVPSNEGDWDKEWLEKRQKNRKPCRCPTSWPTDHSFDQGITPLFSFKGGEDIDVKIKDNKLPGNKQPDRVIGLRKTKAFETALDGLYIHEHETGQPATSVADAVEFTPFKDFGGEPLLFPFLVAEAKSAKAADPFDQIEIQTSFPLRSSIKLQQDLQEVVGDRMKSSRDPLVWFFCWKGEDWRLYACYTRRSEQEIKYEIMLLWSGCVIKRDDALQLFLIVDIIVDWARDKYRTHILSQLKSLSEMDDRDMMSIAHDSDIPSQKRIMSWTAGLQGSPGRNDNATDLRELNESQSDARRFRLFDSKHGCVRRAKDIETRLRGLYITGDNVNDLIQCFANDGQVRKFATSVFDVLSEFGQALHNEDILRRLELEWTERKRSIRNDNSATFATIRFAYYFTVEWDQVRELSYIAVTEKALTVLRGFAAGRCWRQFDALNAPYLDERSLLDTCRSLLLMTPLQNLVAAISRKTLIVRRQTGESPGESQPGTEVVEEEEEDDAILGRLSSCLIQQIYQRHKIGRREPNELFLHVSNRYSEEQPEGSNTASSSSVSLDLADGMILVCANTISVSETRNALLPCLCVYISEQSDEHLDNSKLASALQEFLNRPRIYFSTREGRYSESKLSESNNRPDIYLENSRIPRAFFQKGGILFHPEREIMDWLIVLLHIDEEAEVIDLTIEDDSDECWLSGALQPPSLSEGQDTKPIKAEALATEQRIPTPEESISKSIKTAENLAPHPPKSSYENSQLKQRSPSDASTAGRSMPNIERNETTSTSASPEGELTARTAKRGSQSIQQSNGERLVKRRKR